MGTVIAVGNFDGVHAGHKKVLGKAAEIAAKSGRRSIAFTFTPHPRNFFAGKTVVKTIVDDKYKEKLLKKTGVDSVFFQQFDSSFAALSPQDFIDFLKSEFSCEVIVCGENFTFGIGGKTSVFSMKSVFEKNGIEAVIIPIDTAVSSTIIRQYLTDGNVKKANELLTRPFSVYGKILNGKHLGTTFGFPTINLILSPEMLLPKNGVYASVTEIDGERFAGITNVGWRPTVNNNQSDVTVETFLFDFNRRIYGQTVRIYLLDFIRDEKKFADTDSLIAQIKSDCQSVRQIESQTREFMHFPQ